MKPKRILILAVVVLAVAALCRWFSTPGFREPPVSKTKVLLGQWAVAMETFKSDHGHYPPIDTATHYVNAARFAAALTGRHLDGTPLNSTDDDAGNTKRMVYYSFGTPAPSHLTDAYGNWQIAVLYDTNGDGWINTKDVPGGVAPTVSPAGHPERHFVPDVDLVTGIRRDVIFYSAGKGESAADIIYSWK